MFKYLLIFLLAGAPLLRANEVTHRRAAEKVVEATQVARSLEQTLPKLLDPMVDRMKEQGVSEALAQEMKTAITKWFNREVKWEEVKPQIVTLYMKEYTEEELNEMTVFFTSPIGKKVLAKMPDVIQQSAAIIQAYFRTKQESLQAALKPLVEKARAEKGGVPK